MTAAQFEPAYAEPKPVKVSVSTRPSPLTVLALLLIGGGAFAILGDRLPSGNSSCDPLDENCGPEVGAAGPAAGALREPPTLRASEVCIDVGYLCADLEQSSEIRLQRWKDFEGTLVVHVPLPESVDRGAARELQRAAALGIRQWTGRPFTILTDLRGDRNPHFAVRWSRSLGGSQIGVARTQWSPSTGLTVVSIGLVSHDPFNSGTADPRRVRLTAAHEMGHALGLQHSSARRDVMYPTNTATSLSAQDYRTIEVLYQMEDGTRIRR